jgi:hypothetical protein
VKEGTKALISLGAVVLSIYGLRQLINAVEDHPTPLEASEACDEDITCGPKVKDLYDAKKEIWWKNWRYYQGIENKPVYLDDLLEKCKDICAARTAALDERINNLEHEAWNKQHPKQGGE